MTGGAKAVTRSIRIIAEKPAITRRSGTSKSKEGLDCRLALEQKPAGIRPSREVTPEHETSDSNIFPPGYWDQHSDRVAGSSGASRGSTPIGQSDPVVNGFGPIHSPLPPSPHTHQLPMSNETPTEVSPPCDSLDSNSTPDRARSPRFQERFMGDIRNVRTLDRSPTVSSTLRGSPNPLSPVPFDTTSTSTSRLFQYCLPRAASRDDTASPTQSFLASPTPSQLSTPSVGATSAALARLGFSTEQETNAEDLRAMAEILFQRGIVKRDPRDGLRFTPSRESSVLVTRDETFPPASPVVCWGVF